MRKNIIRRFTAADPGSRKLEYDWYQKEVPENTIFHPSVYIDTSYSFDGFYSECKDGFSMGEGSGCYDRTSIQVGPKGKIKIGDFTILNGTSLISNEYIEIGSHCMLAWGTVLMDSWNHSEKLSTSIRKKILIQTANSEKRFLPFFLHNANPIIIEDNVWIGFDTVICGGIRVGTGAVIGGKTIISENVPAYAVVVGNPPKIVKYLDPHACIDSKDEYFDQFYKKQNL